MMNCILRQDMGDKNEQQVIESPVQSDGPTEEEVVTLFLRVEVTRSFKTFIFKRRNCSKKEDDNRDKENQ